MGIFLLLWWSELSFLIQVNHKTDIKTVQNITLFVTVHQAAAELVVNISLGRNTVKNGTIRQLVV